MIFPVIENGTLPQIVNAAIINSPLWADVTVLTLNKKMRLSDSTLDSTRQQQIAEFNHWVLQLGEGKLPANKQDGELDATWIKIPPELLLMTEGNERVF
ncbi:hypothetical protein ACP4OV_016595 [Aristida adscensionis]